jgi:hypothetical protein
VTSPGLDFSQGFDRLTWRVSPQVGHKTC